MSTPPIGNRVSLPSGSRLLDGWLVQVRADEQEVPKAVLLLHGIGDKLTFWRRIQALLARHGISSLVFDYSGYGASDGVSSRVNLEQDATAAYAWLIGQMPPGTAVFLLGYSLGTGLAAETAPRLNPPPAGVILCQTYTTFREAAACVVRPLRPLMYLVPDLWQTRMTIRQCPAPVLLVHGADDALFPVAMAREVYDAAVDAGVPAALVVVPGHTHNAGYLREHPSYWDPVLNLIKSSPPRSGHA